MAQYRIKPGKIGNALIGTYYKIEDGVVGTYKKIETAFVERFLEKTDDAPKNDEINSSPGGSMSRTGQPSPLPVLPMAAATALARVVSRV